MTGWPNRPVIYELNTAAWLSRRRQEGWEEVHTRRRTAREWDGVTPTGVDAVWLMGVWERSPVGADWRCVPPIRWVFRAALPDLVEGDVIGSAYCVRRYRVDGRFGASRASLRREPRWPNGACG